MGSVNWACHEPLWCSVETKWSSTTLADHSGRVKRARQWLYRIKITGRLNRNEKQASKAVEYITWSVCCVTFLFSIPVLFFSALHTDAWGLMNWHAERAVCLLHCFCLIIKTTNLFVQFGGKRQRTKMMEIRCFVSEEVRFTRVHSQSQNGSAWVEFPKESG